MEGSNLVESLDFLGDIDPPEPEHVGCPDCTRLQTLLAAEKDKRAKMKAKMHDTNKVILLYKQQKEELAAAKGQLAQALASGPGAAEAETLRAQLAKGKSRIAELSQQLQRVGSDVQVGELESTVTKLREELRKKESTENSQNMLIRQLIAAAKTTQEAESIKADRDRLEREAKRLAKEKDAKDKQVEALQQRLQKEKDEIRSVKEQLKEKTQEVKKVEKAEDLQTKIRTLKSQVAALEKKVAGSGALEKLLAEAVERGDALESRVEELKQKTS